MKARYTTFNPIMLAGKLTGVVLRISVVVIVSALAGGAR